MSRKSIGRRSLRNETTTGEVLVGIAWAVLYVALIASGWAHDPLTRVAERSLPGLF